MCLREETGCGGHVLEAIQDHQNMISNKIILPIIAQGFWTEKLGN